ncbi:uncharacterized protein LOC113150043 [Anabas testudineus]|uniref:uncharacterized protein LOC113150043 n=1 Tax=Anabas testudineus TaxID=64144 RepID=UPI000E4570D6|nr:uncharacterized protein LOC113150043 [Anabas testudineus]
MAGRVQIWRLLILLSLLSLTEPFEVRDDEWEELSPDIAALHRLRGLSEHMFHEQLQDPSNHRNTSMHGARIQRSSKRVDIDQNPMSLQDSLQECENFTACVVQIEQDFDSFLAAVDEHKIQDRLLSASEISHSYSQKLLVMTDTEKSTTDTVQHEYSLDPHYSVIVSKECLYNTSCLPEADSYTVVKIFGKVSADGQTVSGLSASSLAELMLKPSLEAAPVFSLHGNTTTDFQHNFMRVLVVRGVKAVLETNQENLQIYQVLDGPDSVSKYQIPQRPVDHSTQYDHQQIIIMEDDPVVRKAATYLYEKHPLVSSVYVLDENRRLKLIQGDSVPLSENSRLVLVGHGGEISGEMRLARYRAEEVAQIIQRTNRISDTIKTTSVVACEVGSDKYFVESLLRELRDTAHIETELHLRNTVIQVRHTGQKITQDMSTDGLKWRHKDDSKKVVAVLDRNGHVIIRKDPGSRGEAVFTNERNFLINQKTNKRFLTYRNSWPSEPRRFIDTEIFRNMPERLEQIKSLEGLSWALFHSDLQTPEKIHINNPEQIKEQYVIGETEHNNIKKIFSDTQKKVTSIDVNKKPKEGIDSIPWIEKDGDLKNILSNCYEIKSGKDIRNIIRHYAKNGEKKPTYLMVNDWIYVVDPQNLYVYSVGKKLNNNQKGNEDKIKKVKEAIFEQIGKEKYPEIRANIQDRESYVRYVKDIFLGEPTTTQSLSTEAWYTTYFTASVISESARNFRTFPLTLMALDMVDSSNNNIRERGLNFFFENHPMAAGNSWIDPSRRGFTGSATPKDSSKLKNVQPRSEGQLMQDLEKVVRLESDMFLKWKQYVQNVEDKMVNIAEQYQLFERNSDAEQTFLKDFTTFREKIEQHVSNLTPSEDHGQPPSSGRLGGYDDGYVTLQDLNSASDLENSFKHESYFSRASSSFAEQIHSNLQKKFGDSLGRLQLKEGSARLEDGQFICQLVHEGPDSKPVEFRIDLSPESQYYTEKMLNGIETAVNNMEIHSSQSSHQVLEHIGSTVGTLGLMLGMKGAVDAFERGDIKNGVVGALQTAHGVTSMTTSVIAKQALSSEIRVARAASTIMRSPAMKGVMTAIPIVGIGFGIYNLEEDLKRGDTLGYVDAAFDGAMIALDVVEIAQPELAPFLVPINLALSTIRMVTDDVYMGIQNELNSLPKDAGVLEKIGAVFVGFDKGIYHFGIHVASFFYNWRYDEIEEGRRLVEQISDHNKYYTVTKEQDGTTAIDFNIGESSWNGGGIHFSLADQGLSQFCLDYFVSSDESFGKKCWDIDTKGSKDIILGLGESHQLEYKSLETKIFLFIPVGSVNMVSGYKAVSNSRYGIYKGNRESNRFFAVQKAEEKQTIEVMLSYYYELYGEPGDDIFFLGPQKSYVEGSGGKDTYIIPENGGKTIINNYDPSKALDTLHFAVDYSHISVSKSGHDVVLMYEHSHTVTIQNWFSGESYRHMTMMSGDGVLFEISSTVVSSVQLVAKGINKMFQTHGQTVDTSQTLLRTVTNIFGSQYDDVLIGNAENNLIDGGGGRDRLKGGEGEDMYVVKDSKQSSVLIENYSTDNKTDLVIIEADLHTFNVSVQGNNVILNALNTGVRVTLVNWFQSPADRHLLVLTKDLITFTISDHKADCLQSDPFNKCIKSLSIDYNNSQSRLVVDLQQDEAFNSVTEVRGSKFDDVIRGNKENNVLVPGSGNDFTEGRGGEDWYVITPGQGVKTINNQSPDRALDILFLKEQYQNITCRCEGKNLIIMVNGKTNVILQNWFVSENYQHLQIRTSDGITAQLMSNVTSCSRSLMLPLIVDYRNQKPEPLQSLQTHLYVGKQTQCFTYRSKNSEDRELCHLKGKVMMMDDKKSVKEIYGSSGFDIMVGNSNDNLLDPFTGGALMFGGEGKDTYIIQHGYGDNIMIDNYAEDQKTDTVLVDMDFLDGSQMTLDSESGGDLNVMITSKGEQFKLRLLNYNDGFQHQHLEFQTSDGVHFKLIKLNSTGDVSVFQVEAFKVTLKQSQVDCRLDLTSHRNLSKVHTVQGCRSQSNNLLGNDRDNALIGGWKDDALEGGEGNDTLIGGHGADILIGGLGDDTLHGEDGNDTMMGNSGSDIFLPGPGADLVDGGPGRDTVLYRGDHEKGKGVYVNLLTGQGRFADAEGDVLKDVETVIGTIYSDVLVSGYESALLKGSDGNDILVSTGGDYLVGDDGRDIYMLGFHHGSVTVNNCAKDNVTDVLYFSSQSSPIFDCHVASDTVRLSFFGINQTAVNVVLDGWVSDDDECGHLVVVFRDKVFSVDMLLQECEQRRQYWSWSFVTTVVVCFSVVFFLCAVTVTLCEKSRKARQQKVQRQKETNVDAESVSLSADIMCHNECCKLNL